MDADGIVLLTCPYLIVFFIVLCLLMLWLSGEGFVPCIWMKYLFLSTLWTSFRKWNLLINEFYYKKMHTYTK